MMMKAVKILIGVFVIQGASTGGDDDEGSDDSYWGSDSESSSESSDDETQYTSIRERFLKKYINLEFNSP
jgi:hypothetical protein